MTKKRYTRRDFIRVSTLITGGLLASFYLPTFAGKQKYKTTNKSKASWATEEEWTHVNIYVKISENNQISIQAPYPEIGQGIRTSMPMLIAEELDADWNLVMVEQAETDQKKYGSQFVGGSTSMRRTYDLLRKNGAILKSMLIQAAANRWGIKTEECLTKNSYVIRKTNGQKLSYGELANDASKISQAKIVKMKNHTQFNIIGTKRKNLDTKNMINGSYKYGIDTQLDHMVYALIMRPPIFGTKLLHYKVDENIKTSGLLEIFKMPNPDKNYDVHRGGLAIIAESSFAAITARETIIPTWSPAKNNIVSSEQLSKIFRNNLKKEGTNINIIGDFKQAYQKADVQIEATYELPFVAHATNEPQNTTVFYSGEQCEIWSPTQVPNYVRSLASKITGLHKDKIFVHVTGIGGGFGRRLEADYAAEAIYVAMKLKKPVQVFWTREDDFTFDFLKPAGMFKMKAGIQNKAISSWYVHHSSTSELTFNNTNDKPWEYEIYPDNYPPAFVPNLIMAYTDVDSNIAVGALRAPGHNNTAFADNCFMDEIAHGIKTDPIQLHIKLIGKDKEWPYNSDGGPILNSQRIKNVILEVKEKSKWAKKMPIGSGQGFAFHFTFGGYIAMVSEVSIYKDGKLRVDKITAVADIGRLVNPAGAEEQVKGGIIDGLNLAMNAEITIQNGRIVQQNFDAYPMLRISEIPEINVSFINTGAAVGGVGEMGLPPVAPSVCNAIFAANGQRIRSLPILKHKLHFVD